MPVCSIVKTITLGAVDDLRRRPSAIVTRSSMAPRGNSLTRLQTGMK